MRRSGALLIAIFAVAALSACGGSPETNADNATKVATLASASATPTPPAMSQRPRYRLDMTAGEKDALMVPYYKCLEEHGYTFVDAKKAGLGNGSVDAPAELRACEEQFYPLPEWERDPANPEAADFAAAVKACLQSKGVKFDGEGFADDNTASALELSPECERKAAEALKK